VCLCVTHPDKLGHAGHTARQVLASPVRRSEMNGIEMAVRLLWRSLLGRILEPSAAVEITCTSVSHLSPRLDRALPPLNINMLGGTGAGFLRVLRFPRPTAPQSSSSSSVIWGSYNRPNSGLSTKWTQSHPMRKKKKGNIQCFWIVH
jgi:hypothetical protein